MPGTPNKTAPQAAASAAPKTHQQKITDLLGQMGATPELQQQFGQLLESFVADQKGIFETKYTSKLEAAKALCLEETNRFKTQLAKRVQLYFEAKADRIESQMAKQVAIRESKAEDDLNRIKSLLEGIEVNVDGKVDFQALQKQLRSLTEQVNVLKEERDLAVNKANRSNAIAQKALSRNRTLEEAAKKGPVVTAPASAASITEGKDGKPAKAPVAAPARRTGTQPTTTASVVTEGVQVGKPKPAQTQQPTGSLAAWNPGNIAASMPE